MADIELVIKIPEGIMEYIKNNGCLSVIYNSEIANAIVNGKSLPKGHGNLVDIKEVEEYLNNIQLELDGWGETDSAVEIAKARLGLSAVSTIIESNTEPTKENSIEQLIDDIEGLTWYRNVHGNLVEGATSETGLYKASDIAKILEKYKRGVEKC